VLDTVKDAYGAAARARRDPLLDRACARRTPVLLVGTEKRIALEQKN
jgi:hypothetical protein